jgi:ABC-type transport system substrate-binding protein
LLAIFIVAVLAVSCVPMLADDPVVGTAAAQTEDYVTIGWLSTVLKWNPLDMSMVEDYIVTYMVYSALMIYDQDWDRLEYDLATDVDSVVHTNGSMTYTITITTNAYFRDISDPTSTDYPLTALDVAATYNMIKNTTGGTWDWYLEELSYFTPIQRSGVWDQVSFWVPYQKVTVLDDISGIPILPMKPGGFWDTIGNPLGSIKPSDNVGSGPFMFEDWEMDSWYAYQTAPNYHGETDNGTAKTVDIPGVMFVVYGGTSGMGLDLNLGKIDVAVLTGDLNAFNEAVGGAGASVNIIKAAVAENGITDIAINAIPDSFDAGGYLNRHEALEDPFVREAIMMTLNKDYIVNDMLGGLPIMACSVVQPGFWQAEIENQLPYDPAGARKLLEEHDWSDEDGDGWLEAGPDSFGVTEGMFDEGTELSGIRCQAIDTDNNYKKIALAWPGWADDAGIQLIGSVESETTMVNEAWYAADYDIWVWHWGWGPEPIGGALTCWLTSEIEKAGDNCQMPMGPWWYGPDNYTDAPTTWYANGEVIEYELDDDPNTPGENCYSAFDQNCSIAMRTLDVPERKVIIDKLQQWIYDSHTENPPYYDLGLYAYTDYRFENWGDWEAHSGLSCQNGLPWLWYMLEPVENLAPVFDDPPEADYTAYVDEAKRFNVTVHDVDSDALWVNFSFGDGTSDFSQKLTTSVDAPTNVETTHTYLAPGEFVFNVSVTDMFEGRYVYREAAVTVLGEPNDPAVLSQFEPDILSPSYIEEVITWTATAADPDSGTKDTGLKFTWDWGDGTYTVEEKASVADDVSVTSEVTHSWALPDVYTVTIHVWDYPAGAISETGDHNVTASMDYTIVANQAPSDPVIEDIAGPSGQALSCVASASDPDMETLRFTWEWDDGTYTVEEITQTYAGQTVTSEAWHTWAAEGEFLVTVYVEDLDGGHNVSADTTAVIDDDINVAPGSIILAYSPDPMYFSVETTFSISATDANSDGITFRVDFGDESAEETDTTAGGVTTRQYVEFLHTYAEEGTYIVTINVTDDNATLALSSETTFEVTVLGNSPPTLTIQTTYVAKYSVETRIQPLSVSDPDGDEFTVWYDWGDDTVSMGDPADSYAGTHTYMDVGTFMLKVSVDDGTVNVSKFANVTVGEVNEKAILEDITVSPLKDEYAKGETITFTVTISDLEGDNVTVTMDFGDGTTDDEVVDLVAKVDTEVVFTHAYETDGDFTVTAEVDDGQPHSDPNPDVETVDITVVKDALNLALIAGIILAILVAIVVVALLLKRRKGGKAPTELGGMEGMSASPEEPASPQ